MGHAAGLATSDGERLRSCDREAWVHALALVQSHPARPQAPL